MDRGIVLAGGGALLSGLDERLRHETQMPAQLAESPLTCVAVGSGRSLEVLEVMQRAAKNRVEEPERLPALDLRSRRTLRYPPKPVPRTRSARVAALGSPVRRAVAPRYSSRSSGPLRRRLVVGLLVLASLVMITVYFRESPNGSLHGFQSAGSTALRPFEIAANRIARPFHDAYNWTADVFHAKAENKQLREDNKRLQQQAIQAATAGAGGRRRSRSS